MANREPTLGDYLRSIRLDRGLSLRKAASLVGIAHSRIVEIEQMLDFRSNKPFKPSYHVLIKFARGYDLPVDELLRRAGYEPGIELTQDEWSLVNLFRGLDAFRRRQLLAVASNLAEEGGPLEPGT